MVLAPGPERQSLVWESRFVMVAFLAPAIVGAIVAFVQNLTDHSSVSPFQSIVPNLPLNALLGSLAYLPTAATVPLAVYLLWRSGIAPKAIGLVRPGLRSDILPGLGLWLASYGGELLLAIPVALITSAFGGTHGAINSVDVGHVPWYYLFWGLVISATTAINEELLINGYLISRLSQFGWTPRAALILSLCLRTSYHVYYGLGFILTVPLGWFVTRSFQKHRRIERAIFAHFCFDASAMVLSIFVLKH